MNNCSYPIHRDDYIHPNAYSLYLSLGDRCPNRFLSPTLGRDFHFDPGTVCIGLASKLGHGWCFTGNGDYSTLKLSISDRLLSEVQRHRAVFPMQSIEIANYMNYMNSL
jgi:hypothetical protein